MPIARPNLLDVITVGAADLLQEVMKTRLQLSAHRSDCELPLSRTSRTLWVERTEADLTAVLNDLEADPTLEVTESLIAIQCLAGTIAARMAHINWAQDPRQLAIFIVSDRTRN